MTSDPRGRSRSAALPKGPPINGSLDRLESTPQVPPRVVPAVWVAVYAGAGITSNLGFASPFRFPLLGIACATLLALGVMVSLRDSRSSAHYMKKTTGHPFLWLLAAYLTIVLQEIVRPDADFGSILSSLPAAAALVGAAAIWMHGYSIDIRHLRIAIYSFFVIGVVTGLVSTATAPCRPEKCSVAGFLYSGGFNHENTMGYAATLAFVSLVLWPPREHLPKWLLGLAALVPLAAAAASGAQGAYFACATALLLVFMVRVARWRAHLLARLFPFGIAALSLLLIYAVETPEALSFRGRRWIVIREALSPLPFFGNGVDAWKDLQTLFVESTTTHTVYGSYLVHGGLITLGLFACFLSSALKNAHISQSSYLVGVCGFLIAASMVYSIWNPATFGVRGWTIPAVVLAIPHGLELVRSDDGHHRHTRHPRLVR